MRADAGCLPGFDRWGRFMVRDKGRSVDKDDSHNTGRDIGANLNHDTGPKNGQAHCRPSCWRTKIATVKWSPFSFVKRFTLRLAAGRLRRGSGPFSFLISAHLAFRSLAGVSKAWRSRSALCFPSVWTLECDTVRKIKRVGPYSISLVFGVSQLGCFKIVRQRTH